MKNIILTIIILLPLISAAQNKPNLKVIETLAEKLSVSDDAQSLIMSVLDSSICIIRKDYVLKDSSGKRTYGRKNKDYYGRIYFTGLYSGNKLWVPAIAEAPWKIDARYTAKYKDTLQPVTTGSSVRGFNAGRFDSLKTVPSSTDSTLAVYDNINKAQNLNVLYTHKDSAGYLVLILTPPSFEDRDDTDMERKIIKVHTSFSDSTGFGTPEKFKAEPNLIGGVYFSVIKSSGKLELKPSGMLVRRNDKWVVAPFRNIQPAGKKKGQEEDDDISELIQKN